MFYSFFKCFAKSADPGEIPPVVALHLSLHCLSKYPLRGFWSSKDHVRIHRGRGQGVRTPLEITLYIGLLSNTVRIPFKSQGYQSIIQCWAIIGPPAKPWPFKKAFRLRAVDDPLIVVFGSFLPSSKKNIIMIKKTRSSADKDLAYGDCSHEFWCIFLSALYFCIICIFFNLKRIR